MNSLKQNKAGYPSRVHGAFPTRQQVTALGRQPVETKGAIAWSSETKKCTGFVPIWLHTSAVRPLLLYYLGHKA